jgi:hypothetical protein
MASGVSLNDLVSGLITHQPLQTFRGSMGTLTVIIHRASGETTITLDTLAPFHTIEDIHRAAWLHEDKSDDLYPKYSYFAYDSDGTMVPAMGTFRDIETEDGQILRVPEPVQQIRSGQRLAAFLYEDGTKKNIQYSPHGRLTIEDKFQGVIPTFHIYPLRYLLTLYTGARPISQVDWNGLFFPYFPALDPSSSGDMTPQDRQQVNSIEQLMSAKLQDTAFLERLVGEVADSLEPLRTSGIYSLLLQWLDRQEVFENEGVDTLFFRAPVNEQRPYMRLLMPNTTPLTKLYQPDILQPPTIHDPKLLKSWTDEPSPVSDENFLFVKIPIRDSIPGLKPLYGTFRFNDDMTADFTLQPPKDIRILDMSRDISDLANKLRDAIEDIYPTYDSVRLGRVSMNVKLKFEGQPPKQIRQMVATRIAKLETLFQRITPPKDDKKPFLALRYKAVSNFTTADKIDSYLRYIVARRGITQETSQQFVPTLMKEFDISEDEAIGHLANFINDTTEVGTTDEDGKEFAVLQNPGIDISIFSQDFNTFTIQLFNMRAVNLIDIQRVLTILSMAFKGAEDAWDGEQAPTAAQQVALEAATLAVEREDLREEATVAVARAHPVGRFIGMENLNILGDIDEDEMEEVAAAVEAPAPVTVAVAAPKVKGKAAAAQAVEEPDKIVGDQWFINQLKRLDPVLFQYEPPPGKLQYTRACAANWDRQPVILTHDQFQNVVRMYSTPKYINRVAFIIYGERDPNPFTPSAAIGRPEKLTVLRYGSDPNQTHYFTCPHLFCLKDYMPIFDSDWESSRDYNDERKDEYSCPFCHGKQIVNLKRPGPGETVILRKDKPKDNKPHSFIGFLRGSSHPNGYELPCCFTSQHDIAPTDARFKAIRDADKAREPAQAQVEEMVRKQEKLEDALKGREQLIVSYDVLQWKLPSEYVLGPEKFPLEPGKIGLPSLALDSYFGQTSTNFVGRVAIKQQFESNVNGFFRLGVLNKVGTANQSLFAALGPLLGKNTVSAVAEHMISLITPRIFLNLNFGNLLLEFFKPEDPMPVMKDIRRWAERGTLNPDMTEFELSRLYRSYHRFEQYIRDPSAKKQLRHFAHALAEPRLLTEDGVTIVTLYYKGDPREVSTDVEVLCPMLGFDMQRYEKNNIAFLTYSEMGIWEPLVYIGNLSTTETASKSAYYKLTVEDMEEPTFPKMVAKRLGEFTSKCSSAYRGAFTLQRGVGIRGLMPISQAITILSKHLRIKGIVRDSYNHLVAMTVELKTGGRGGEVILPVVNDGSLFYDKLTLSMYLSMDSVRKASAKEVETVYGIVHTWFRAHTNMYVLKEFVTRDDGTIFAFRIGNDSTSIKLPCGDLVRGEALTIPTVSWETLEDESQSLKDCKSEQERRRRRDELQFDFEYQLNRELQVKGSEKVESIKVLENEFIVTRKQAEEIYQHLRLSFANWIATSRAAQMRTFLDQLLENRTMSAAMKIQALQVEFGSTIEDWFTTSEQVASEQILLRNDCIQITDPDKCSGMCKMDSGECKIHAPTQVQIRSTPRPSFMPSAKYFALRLFDEIVRLPALRNELLTKGVKRVHIPSTNVHIGNAWILPENVPAWYDLLREGTQGTGKEAPQYYEEFSRDETDQSRARLFEEKDWIDLRDERVPAALRALFPEPVLDSLALKVIARSQTETRMKSIAEYIGTTIEISAEDRMSPEEMRDVSAQIDESITQVLTGVSPVAITTRSSGLDTPKQTIVLFPDSSLGPTILIYVQDGGITIPVDHLGERIRQTVIEKQVAPGAAAVVAAIAQRRANLNRTRRRANTVAATQPQGAPVPQVPNAEALALRMQRIKEIQRAQTLRKQRNQPPSA